MMALERMKPRLLHPFAIMALALVTCAKAREAVDHRTSEDKAVIAVVLKDFAHWKEATFGNLEGFLELDPLSDARSDATARDVKSLLPEIAEKISDDLVAAYIERNKVAVPVTALIADSPWARIRKPASKDAAPWNLPAGAKATGSLSLPGYSADGSKALILINHSWSIHGAIVTYVLSKQGDRWDIVARDQAVFL